MNTEERQLLLGVARVIRDMVGNQDIHLIARYVESAFPSETTLSSHPQRTPVDRLNALIDRVAETEILPPAKDGYSERKLFGVSETPAMPPRFKPLKFGVPEADRDKRPIG